MGIDGKVFLEASKLFCLCKQVSNRFEPTVPACSGAVMLVVGLFRRKLIAVVCDDAPMCTAQAADHQMCWNKTII